jgi:hypothetical protein
MHFHFSWKSYQGWLAFILSNLSRNEKPGKGKPRLDID